MTNTMLALVITSMALIVFIARSAFTVSGRGTVSLPGREPAVAVASAPDWPLAPPQNAPKWTAPPAPVGAGEAEGPLHMIIWKVQADGGLFALAEPVVLADITHIGADTSNRIVLPSMRPSHLVVRRVGPQSVLVRDLSAPGVPAVEITVDQPMTVSGFRLEIF